MSTTKQKSNVPYVALYRRWRPQLFSQIVGQQHVTRTLQNALSSSRVAHAYLFCGLRGTGKTTMAKLLAKALNCEKGVAQEPCNACRSCREINEGNSLDVIEIDAASNRGIDEIRELREKIRYAAASSRYKVYIIDEVHMLTNEAFNALLKTLEEPPPNVVFILATTEVHKLPLTVVSRCQRGREQGLSRFLKVWE
jgi:DNA polymerase-3 subunit gamma/tau